MGSEIQRALLWILFGLSAFMLYDRWEVYNGRPSFFGAETHQTVSANQKNVAELRLLRRAMSLKSKLLRSLRQT